MDRLVGEFFKLKLVMLYFGSGTDLRESDGSGRYLKSWL